MLRLRIWIFNIQLVDETFKYSFHFNIVGNTCSEALEKNMSNPLGCLGNSGWKVIKKNLELWFFSVKIYWRIVKVFRGLWEFRVGSRREFFSGSSVALDRVKHVITVSIDYCFISPQQQQMQKNICVIYAIYVKWGHWRVWNFW
jgi:hypothetical protein